MAWQGLVNIVRNLGGLISPKYILKDSGKGYLGLTEFFTYTSDVLGVFKHVEGQENFTGQSAKAHLKTLCELLEPLGDDVHKHQASQIQVTIPTGVGYVPNLFSKAVYLEGEQYPTIDGLRSKPQKPGYLEAGKFLEYIGDVARLFTLLHEKGGEFLSVAALKTVGEINQQLSYLKKAFAQEGVIKRIELKKDYQTLRKFV